jgi:hypothetical protein
MSDVNISKYRAQVIRQGSTPASPGFVVSEGQNPVDPSGSGQTHLPVTIATVSTGLSITESQILSGAGLVSQYIRGDGSLADFPATTGGGSSVSYYLNGSVSQGTIGGVAYKQLNRTPVFGAGTDITINADGYIASFITDASDPNKLLIPAGNWNFETYFSASSSGGSPSFYVELYKYNGTTFTLIATSSSAPELIAFGTSLNPYFSTLAVPQTTLALTDRLALRYYVTHSGRTITLHTENNHLCQIITTFTTGLTALNGLTAQVQNFAVGTSGTDFAIASATATHTFNLPTASATNRGALSSADWTTFNSKQNALTNPVTGTGTTNTLPKFTGASTIGNSLFTDNGTNGAFGGANYYAGTDLRTFNISAPLYAGLAFWANNQSVGSIIGFGVTGNLILNADQSNLFANTKIILSIDDTERFAVFSNGNVSIANSPTDNGAKFQVSGTATISGQLSVTSGLLSISGAGATPPSSGVGLRFVSNRLIVYGGSSDITFQKNDNSGPNLTILESGAATFSSSVDARGNISMQYDGTAENQAILSHNGTSAILYSSGNTTKKDFTIYRDGGVDAGLIIKGSNGNVGIGTSSPSYGLDIASSGAAQAFLRITKTSGAQAFLQSFDNAAYFGTINNFPLVINTNGSERMRITSSGDLMLKGRSTTTNYEAVFYNDNSQFAINANNTSVGKTINFNVRNDQNAMTITASGNVGIGTASPTSILQIGTGGGASSTRTSLQFSNGGFSTTNLPSAPGSFSNGDKLIFWDDGSGKSSIGVGNGYNMILQSTGASNSDIQFFTGTSGAGTERARITSGGNVGIGTTSPGGFLEVSSPNSGNTQMLLVRNFATSATGNFTGNYTAEVRGASNGNVRHAMNIHLNENASDRRILDITSSFGTVASFLSNGRVLIGTTTDIGERLTLNGRIGIVGATVASGNYRSFFVRGSQNVADGGTLTINVTNTALIFIAENNTGTGALFFLGYASGTITKISDVSNIFDVADTAGKLCIFKSAVSDVATIKNRLGSTKNITVSFIGVSD